MDYDFYFSGSDEGFGIIFLSVWLISLITSGTVGIAVYVFRSYAVYTIARRRGLDKPWLAWIPVASDYILGSLSDQYKYLTQGKIQSRRKLLLGLSIGVAVCGFISVILTVVTVVNAAITAGGIYDDAQMAVRLMGPVLGIMVVSLITSIVSIIWLVFYYICKYDLYQSCDPKNAVAYLVLSIFFQILDPIFLMIVRNKDLGMPPRKPVQEQPVYQTSPAYAAPDQSQINPEGIKEPWEQ